MNKIKSLLDKFHQTGWPEDLATKLSWLVEKECDVSLCFHGGDWFCELEYISVCGESAVDALTRAMEIVK